MTTSSGLKGIATSTVGRAISPAEAPSTIGSTDTPSRPRPRGPAGVGPPPARGAEPGVVRCRVGAHEARRQGRGELDVDVAREPHGEGQLVDDPDPNQPGLLPAAHAG